MRQLLSAYFTREDDLDLIGIADLHGIVLPKTESGADVIEIAHRTGSIPIHAIVTETASGILSILTAAALNSAVPDRG